MLNGSTTQNSLASLFLTSQKLKTEQPSLPTFRNSNTSQTKQHQGSSQSLETQSAAIVLILCCFAAQGLQHPSWRPSVIHKVQKASLREGMRLLNFSFTLKLRTVATSTVCYHQRWMISYTKKKLQSLIHKTTVASSTFREQLAHTTTTARKISLCQ